jgi:chemotaxis signal transduction protein
VREILQYQRPTTIPQMPAFIHGVMNLRGSVLPVIDLAQRLGHGAGKVLRRSCIVIVETAASSGQDLGLLVDAVHEVISLPAATSCRHRRLAIRCARLHCRHGHAGWPHILLLNMDKSCRWTR